MSVVTTLTKVVDNLANFLSPYLHDILQHVRHEHLLQGLETTGKSLNFVGSKFHGLTTMDIVIDS